MFAIGEASRRSGVSIETIRYYEREGITSKPGRSPYGRRVYSDAEISELTFIRRCRDLGFPISDIRALRALSGNPEGACSEVAGLATRHLSEVRAKISDLKVIEAALNELVLSCETGRARCPMLENLLSERAPPEIGG
ncbi:MAG: helix-turn-helix domain-containing protein [Silicimonas sp.]|nr:helix-turn-helix domain-containing protein [Silicimonas sp.]